MIALLFSVGSDRYALPASAILEVLPLVALKRVPPAPPCLAGLLNDHGAAVPVVDVCVLIGGLPCKRSLSSRVVLAKYLVAGARFEPLGLMIERATEMTHIDPAALIPAKIDVPAAPYLGKLNPHGAELVQLVDVTRLLSDTARDLLYPHHEDVPCPAGPGAH